jgi:hypothetical protein
MPSQLSLPFVGPNVLVELTLMYRSGNADLVGKTFWQNPFKHNWKSGMLGPWVNDSTSPSWRGTPIGTIEKILSTSRESISVLVRIFPELRDVDLTTLPVFDEDK